MKLVKLMPIMLSFNLSITLMQCVNLFPFMKRSISKIPNKLILLPEAVTHVSGSAICLGLVLGKAKWKEAELYMLL